MILRGWDVDTVIISGATTENCCHATARDALFRDYKVVFLSDATATFDYPDRGFGAMSAAEVHRAVLVILASSTAHVMSVAEVTSRVSRRPASPVGEDGVAQRAIPRHDDLLVQLYEQQFGTACGLA